MTKQELDRRAKEILESEVLRTQRCNMVLAGTEDLSRILGLTLNEVVRQYGRWDTYTLEVVGKVGNGYLLRFTDGQEIELEWEAE